MEAYTSFARVYDMFMDNVPYEVWSRYIVEKLRANGIDSGYVVDLGCGTGKLTTLLADAGYDMIGIDNSFDMLDMALEREDDRILYLMQDMREFEPGEKVSAVVSACDSINYILDPEEVEQVFRLVDNYLDPEGIFLFDFNTDYKYREIIGSQVIAEDREEMSFIWDNDYDEESRINEYELSLFIREQDDLYRKYQELHYQRGYTLEEMKEALSHAGLLFLSAEDGEEGGPVTETTGRILITARECKKGKNLEVR